ncbi:AEC family transporter [Synechococcus sp. PCC 7336]|uniref:AEC family transporter n=1 Tax=Synechococcus sp. PCC 7336 TaxID=195250 RepID=UPI00034D5609|nr:AEC family transporter [Synechococcus sp. PCC 7336]
MSSLTQALIGTYTPLIGWTVFGAILGRQLPKIVPKYIGLFLFWIGVPISTIAFMHDADLSGIILMVPATAWVAILVGAGFALLWIDLELNEERVRQLTEGLNLPAEASEADSSAWPGTTRGSFLLAMMVGNTGYIGFPVILNLLGQEYFSWALLYDFLGTDFGVQVLGVAIAARYGSRHLNRGAIARVFRGLLLENPALWALGVGLLLRSVQFPNPVESSLNFFAWSIVSLALILIGMKLGQLRSIEKFGQAIPTVSIKMLLVPLVVGTALMFFDVTEQQRLAMVLQMGMPPAFGTLVLAEAYNLDRDLAVSALAMGTVVLLFTLPIWLLLFGT